MPDFSPEQLVVSVEHASPRVPPGLARLGLAEAFLSTHHSWDPGAAPGGRFVAQTFGAPLHLGRWSRLVADLNRTSNHRHVVARHAGGRPVPGNTDLSKADRRDRLDRYWAPYRDAVEADLDRVIAGHGRVLHLSVHTFTPRLNGDSRHNDFGLLYKPSHRAERAMADRWDRQLTERGFRVRRNYPYSGLDDGFCMRMRAERCPDTYLGMEVEMNQRGLRESPTLRHLAKALVEVIEREWRE